MPEPSASQQFINELLERLGFQGAEAHKAYGEVQGNPTTLTVLGGDPVSILLAFKIATPHPETIVLPAPLEALKETGQVEVELENGFAWLTLKNLGEEPASSTQELIESFGAALVLAEIACPPGCLKCQSLDDSQLIFAEGRCTRLCFPCVKQLVDQRDAAEHTLNKPTLRHALGLLPAFLAAALGWVLFWTAIDLLLEWWRPDKIELPDIIFGLLILGLGGVGCCLGYPLGLFLRRSGVPIRSPVAISLVTVIPAGLLGEFLYVVLYLFRQAGFFNLALTVQLFVPFVTSYPVSWMVGKILVVGGIALGSYLAANKREKVALKL